MLDKGAAVALCGLLLMLRALSMLVSGTDKFQANWIHMIGMALVIIGYFFADKSDES